MNSVVRITLSCDLLATCAQQGVPWLHSVGPLGGSHFAQLSILIVAAIAAVEMSETLSEWWSKFRRDGN